MAESSLEAESQKQRNICFPSPRSLTDSEEDLAELPFSLIFLLPKNNTCIRWMIHDSVLHSRINTMTQTCGHLNDPASWGGTLLILVIRNYYFHIRDHVHAHWHNEHHRLIQQLWKNQMRPALTLGHRLLFLVASTSELRGAQCWAWPGEAPYAFQYVFFFFSFSVGGSSAQTAASGGTGSVELPQACYPPPESLPVFFSTRSTPH